MHCDKPIRMLLHPAAFNHKCPSAPGVYDTDEMDRFDYIIASAGKVGAAATQPMSGAHAPTCHPPTPSSLPTSCFHHSLPSWAVMLLLSLPCLSRHAPPCPLPCALPPLATHQPTAVCPALCLPSAARHSTHHGPGQHLEGLPLSRRPDEIVSERYRKDTLRVVRHSCEVECDTCDTSSLSSAMLAAMLAPCCLPVQRRSIEAARHNYQTQAQTRLITEQLRSAYGTPT